MKKALARALGVTVAAAAALSLGAWAQGMTREPGTNRRGNDYASFRVSEIPECEEACARDRRCQAYTFDSKAGLCYLKDRVPEAVQAPSRTSGVKRGFDGGHGGDGGGGRGLSEERGIDYHGGDYTSLRVRGLGDCQDECRSDRRCVSYSYDLRAAVCYLKDRVGDRRRDGDKVGGVKQRSGPGRPPYPGGDDSWEQRGYDYHGGDYASLRVRGLGDCQDECRSDRRCRAYSYDVRAAMCYLKDRIGDRRRDGDKVTGLKQRY
jgi:hypothetical protein